MCSSDLREVNVSVEEIELATTAPEGFDCDCVLAQITELKPEYADLLRRVIIDGESITHVAGELGLTANNAMVRLHRARKALQDAGIHASFVRGRLFFPLRQP